VAASWAKGKEKEELGLEEEASAGPSGGRSRGCVGQLGEEEKLKDLGPKRRGGFPVRLGLRDLKRIKRD
jgi:hypothetical protein